ncbi:MAG: multiprotein bridging factor aMBF1 [Candidatus Bathyarchaeota archaeon]|nr:multiprotein bridging factor aMBF1 [Candidatus Bathyarchaeota archaeon]
MNCEVCGRNIDSTPYKAIIEGARLVVCHDCSVLGSISWELRNKSRTPSVNVRIQKRLKIKPKKAGKPQSPMEPAFDLVQDFGFRIKRAREERDLTPEDLGRKINEKVSVLKKLENQKMRPADKLARKLERALRIQLLATATTEQVSPKRISEKATPKAITLGDLIKKKPAEETE